MRLGAQEGRAGSTPNNSKALDTANRWLDMVRGFRQAKGSPFTVNTLTNNSYALSTSKVWYPNVVGDWGNVRGGQSIDHW